MRRYLVIGGTGSLGQALIRKLDSYGAEITVFSRDELKQSQLKSRFPEVKCILGDVRDRDAVFNATRNKNVVFNFAALKRIEAIEENPVESKKTNVDGPINVAEACVENSVKYSVFTGTDKMVLPITSYGYSKALASNILLRMNETQFVTSFSVYAYGNILASRGSVVPMFVNSLLEKGELNITHPKMTRFWMSLDSIADFILDGYSRGPFDAIKIPVMKASTVEQVGRVIAVILGITHPKVNYIGLRCIEKIHECIYSSHEDCLRSDNCAQYTNEELIELLEPIVRSLT